MYVAFSQIERKEQGDEDQDEFEGWVSDGRLERRKALACDTVLEHASERKKRARP